MSGHVIQCSGLVFAVLRRRTLPPDEESSADDTTAPSKQYVAILFYQVPTSSSFASFHQSHVNFKSCHPSAWPLAIVRSWVGRAGASILGQTSRYCVACLMPQSHVSVSFEYSNVSMFTLDQIPTKQMFASSIYSENESYKYCTSVKEIGCMVS